MRKTVDLGFEWYCLLVFMPTVLPCLTSIAKIEITPCVDYWFTFWNVLFFAANIILQTHLIRFTIDSHFWAEVVEIIFEAINIIVTVQGYFIVVIDPTFVYWSSAFLPFSAMNWSTKLGIIASNKQQRVSLFQDNIIVNNNNLTELLHISMGTFVIRCLILLYLIPFKVDNDPNDLRGPFYLFTKRYWTRLCKN